MIDSTKAGQDQLTMLTNPQWMSRLPWQGLIGSGGLGWCLLRADRVGRPEGLESQLAGSGRAGGRPPGCPAPPVRRSAGREPRVHGHGRSRMNAVARTTATPTAAPPTVSVK